ncbi:acetolactate synthase large subunit [Prauserella halophila]|uniref:Acetolactate synthase large subunit n=1 Tax=Prauserella halophila TaxID=185641 RepID=A0ABN1W3F7_9PSEU|nr:acetolactate synthase large subunit [Prauserella halophila]MCP2236152.1 acetolactate synthase-1/2/3 large subunit [Prauserella halophila]
MSEGGTGAQALLGTLAGAGVEVVFANPGTSEMHFVAALESDPRVRGVLGLAEGAVTGAADGYARMSGIPGVTLLHLGPGLGNGLANLHNARRAHSPVVNVVGDHATYHKRFDAPLESDIDAVAGTLGRVLRSETPADVGPDAAAALAAAQDAPGGVATLILPADASWSDGGVPAAPVTPREPAPVSTVDSVALACRSGEPVTLLLGGVACRERGLRAASRIAEATGARLLLETFPARLERGAGLPTVERLGYVAEQAEQQLAGTAHLVVAGARPPATFFAYPGKRGDLVPDGAALHPLAEPGDDVTGALEELADLVAPGTEPALAPARRPDLPAGELTVANWADVIGALLPDDAIIVDETNTSGMPIAAATAGAPRHDVLSLTGGAIGQGIPAATGAAVAAPSRPVVNLEADGSAMYTISALWTQAREGLNVTTVILNNRAYAILRMELQRTGAGDVDPAKAGLFDLSTPDIDFTRIAEGMGVPAATATTAEELADRFRRALAEPGPNLIDARIPPLL